VITYLLMGHQADPLMPFIVATVALIILKHQQNIRRLIAGNEHRFGASHPDEPTPRPPSFGGGADRKPGSPGAPRKSGGAA
jgi:hypothetical protein